MRERLAARVSAGSGRSAKPQNAASFAFGAECSAEFSRWGKEEKKKRKKKGKKALQFSLLIKVMAQQVSPTFISERGGRGMFPAAAAADAPLAPKRQPGTDPTCRP